MTCKNHRSYRGIKPPTVECDACWDMYNYPDERVKKERRKFEEKSNKSRRKEKELEN